MGQRHREFPVGVTAANHPVRIGQCDSISRIYGKLFILLLTLLHTSASVESGKSYRGMAVKDTALVSLHCFIEHIHPLSVSDDFLRGLQVKKFFVSRLWSMNTLSLIVTSSSPTTLSFPMCCSGRKR
jgi:hypothetical protein